MARACIDCGGRISPRSKARCQTCCNAVAYRSPEARVRLSELAKARWQDPWQAATMRSGLRGRAAQ